MGYKTRTLLFDDFYGAGAIPDYGSGNSGRFVSRVVGAAPPTCTVLSGACHLALTAAEQIQNVCLYQFDKLPFDIDDLIRVSFKAALNAVAVDAVIDAAIGVASAYNAAFASTAAHALFKITGTDTSHVVECESDDGTNDNDDVATGLLLATTYKNFSIDFSQGHQTIGPPGDSLAGKGSVQFFMDNAAGNLVRVGRTTNFDMSNYTAGLQLFAMIKKTSDTALSTVSVKDFEVEYRV